MTSGEAFECNEEREANRACVEMVDLEIENPHPKSAASLSQCNHSKVDFGCGYVTLPLKPKREQNYSESRSNLEKANIRSSAIKLETEKS